MSLRQLLVSPSILSADFNRLGEEITSVEQAGADWIHIDVMDGHFVPNITIGPMIVEAVKRIAQRPLDVHLMISNPDSYIDAFHAAGANILAVHVEACVHLHRTISYIKSLGMKAGVALNPSTSPESIRYVLRDLDLVMLMTVNPGFGGQSFISSMLPKIGYVRNMIDEIGSKALIEVDGGVSPTTAPSLVAAGVDVVVAGSAVFNAPPYDEAIGRIKAAGSISV